MLYSAEITDNTLNSFKIRNLWANSPKSLKGIIPAEAKKIFYATSEQETRERFKEWRVRWEREIPKVVDCSEKYLDSVLTVYKFPYRHWEKIRTTNIIERAFREFGRRTRAMDSFPTEESHIRIMFALAKLLDDDWKHKPIKGF